ncbi:MAG: hypothetical protein JWR50_2431 [Mucilaginibacter sp.]|nr:hypothetical protein [Mucilaginibacter sp.]
MNSKLLLSGLICFLALSCYSQKKKASLVPDKPSAAPDYFCTWNVQGYVVNYSSSVATRQAMTENNIFGNGAREGWANMFTKLHRDLFLVLDDDWETPLNGDKNYYGSLIIDDERFPSVKGMSPEQKLDALSGKTKQLGWKGLGLWICAQQAPRYKTNDDAAYWTERFNWMNKAGITYWKVDWGEQEKNAKWRASLTKLGQQFAPNLTIEQSMTPAVLSSAATYRTYDVENIIAVPHTIDRVGKLLTALPEGQAVSIINCEDEPYIAAGLGCSIGIMRHEFNGKLPNGAQDHVFPPIGRDLKSRLDEVTRCVMWHRIALPFGINKTSVFVDTAMLHDYWLMKDHETWMSRPEGYKNAWRAPAVITRGLEKPIIVLQKGDTINPYILASRYPNGAIAIASIGRTIGREYLTPRADVTLKADRLDKPFGIFGHYNNLTIEVARPAHFTKVLAQDLAGNTPVDISRQITRKGNIITIPGTIIDRVGLAAATKGDKSEPGMVLEFQ